jgi:diacylglycerol kinase family enzyme
MGAIGIVNNPRALRNRRKPETGERLRALLAGDGEVLDAGTPEELERAVERFRAARIDVLGVLGGDGTTHLALTAFARAWGPDPLPALLPLRGGGMNTVARGHRIRGTPERILREVLRRRRAGVPLHTVDRDLLQVVPDGEPPSYGFIFGTGAVVAFLDTYYRSGRPTPAMSAWLLARGVASTLVRGNFAGVLERRERLRVTSDGEVWPDELYLAFLAGSTPQIGFGVRAFARFDEQPGFFHAIGVTAGLAPLVAALPRIRRGAPWRRRVALDEVARAVVLEGESIRYTVDGDLYAARRTVRVATGPTLPIVLPW